MSSGREPLDEIRRVIEEASKVKVSLGGSQDPIPDSLEMEMKNLKVRYKKPLEYLSFPDLFIDPSTLYSVDKKMVGVDGGLRSVVLSALSVGIIPVSVTYEGILVYEYPHIGFGDELSSHKARYLVAYHPNAYDPSGPNCLSNPTSPFCPLINWNVLSQSIVPESYSNAVAGLTPSNYNRATMMDENRLIAETKALEWALANFHSSIVAIDGPLFPTPLIFGTYERYLGNPKYSGSVIVSLVSYLYNVVERAKVIKSAPERAIGVVKRLNKARLLSKNTQLNNDQELLFYLLRDKPPGVYVWGPINITLDLHSLVSDIKMKFWVTNHVKSSRKQSKKSPSKDDPTPALNYFLVHDKIDIYGRYTIADLLKEASKLGSISKRAYYVGIKGIYERVVTFRVEVFGDVPSTSDNQLVSTAVAKTVLSNESISYPYPIFVADKVVKEIGKQIKDTVVQSAIMKKVPVMEVDPL